jgi:hypothetical protein
MSFTKLDYCQYLLSSQTNYTLTNMAEHLQSRSHDTINRIPQRAKNSCPACSSSRYSRSLGERPESVPDLRRYRTPAKSFGPSTSEVTRKQCSGNEKSVIGGIGVVSSVYDVNPQTERFWVIDYRIFDPDADGKTKLDHLRDMLRSVSHRGVHFETVLMDSWYATKDLMVLISRGWKRGITARSKEQPPSGRLRGPEALPAGGGATVEPAGTGAGQARKDRGVPKGAQGEALPYVAVHPRRTERIVTNDPT